MSKVVLITGAAKRVGAAIARHLHEQGMRIIIHYRQSELAAQTLCEELNQFRPKSAAIVQADLLNYAYLPEMVSQAQQLFGRLDALVNNASTFYPTPLGSVTEAMWDDLMGSNCKAAYFLSQAAAPFLAKQEGSIINIVDIHAKQPLPGYSVYCIGKAGLAMLTLALANELAPKIRVNGISPGPIIWPDLPENKFTEKEKNAIIANTPLQHIGSPLDIAKTVSFLLNQADYITGQIIAVDGGRSINYSI